MRPVVSAFATSPRGRRIQGQQVYCEKVWGRSNVILELYLRSKECSCSNGARTFIS